VQYTPIDRDFPRADTKESAKVDDGGAHQAGMVDHDIDNAPHVIAAGTLHRFAEECVRGIAFDDDGRRFGTGWCRDGWRSDGRCRGGFVCLGRRGSGWRGGRRHGRWFSSRLGR